MLNHSGILKETFAKADEFADKKTKKIPLGEHILQTNVFISMLSDKMPDISKMVTNVLGIKKRKRLMLAEPKPQEEEEDYLDNPLEGDRL